MRAIALLNGLSTFINRLWVAAPRVSLLSAFCGLILLSWVDAPPARAGGDLDPSVQWGRWRGPLGTGVAPAAHPPVTWSEDSNVLWKIAIPGRGMSTPVMWGNRLYLTTAVPHGDAVAASPGDDPGAHNNVPPARRHKYTVMAINRLDGRVLWETTVRDQQPHEATHSTGSWASHSPVTDGKRLYVSFGSAGIYAMDLDGKVLWETDLGEMQTRHTHGEGSSPALHGDSLVVNWDHQGPSFVTALDTRTGKERWRVARDEITSWSTPLVVDVAGKSQVIISATGKVRSYDLNSGELIWEVGGLARNVVSTPGAGHGMVYVTGSYDWQAMLAIRLAGARGDLTGSEAVVWTRDRDTPYVPSPLLHENLLCFTKHLSGILTCVEASSGKTLAGPLRLPEVGGIFASPVAASGRIYIAGQSGAVLVMGLGGDFPVLAINKLDDSFSASPALVGGHLYLRGHEHLYCLAEPESGER